MKRLNLIFSLLVGLFISSYCYSSADALKDVKGEAISLDSLKGKWVLINYWASWCQPCVDEISELNRFYQQNKDKVAMFAVNFEHVPLAQQQALVKKFKISYPSLSQDPARMFGIGKIKGVPATFVINPEGKIVARLYGEQTVESLSKVTSKVG